MNTICDSRLLLSRVYTSISHLKIYGFAQFLGWDRCFFWWLGYCPWLHQAFEKVKDACVFVTTIAFNAYYYNPMVIIASSYVLHCFRCAYVSAVRLSVSTTTFSVILCHWLLVFICRMYTSQQAQLPLCQVSYQLKNISQSEPINWKPL